MVRVPIYGLLSIRISLLRMGADTTMRPDITAGLKEEKDGGTGRAIEFWNWCDEVTKPFSKG